MSTPPGFAATDPELRAVDHVEAQALRTLFGTFLTGVTVVTAFDAEGRRRGFTANSFSAVSLEPPLVLVCLRKAAFGLETFLAAERFGISILCDGQGEVSRAFASPSPDKFSGVRTVEHAGGAPLIAGSLALLDCARHAVVDAGDHVVLIGRVLRFGLGEGRPLGYFRGGYVGFEAGTLALERRLGGEAIRVGALVAHAGAVLLWRRPGEDHWALPDAPLRPGETHRGVLPALLRRLGIAGELPFLFSVFQDRGDPHTTMIFRGEADAPPARTDLADGTALRLFGEDEAPWARVRGSSSGELLRRFFRERAAARFGIYWDTHEDGGLVAAIAGAPRHWPSAAAETLDQEREG